VRCALLRETAHGLLVDGRLDLGGHDREVPHHLVAHLGDTLLEVLVDRPRLARLSSTTFDAQLEVATRVAAENPELYYEIQSLNAYGEDAIGALKAAVDRLARAVHEHDEGSFVDMMLRGREYLMVRQAARGQDA
jgi:prephenate dehydrogenase